MAAFERLIGLETEYAFRFSPDSDGEPVDRPGNDLLFRAFKRAIREIVPTRPGTGAPGRDQFFTANGGAFYYEFLPHCTDGGLLEGATPECRSPAQLLLFQQAQETLLVRAREEAQAIVHRLGHPGTVGLLKNCRDAEGHVYGSQENYEAPVARGFVLALYRLGLALLLPALLVQVLLSYVLFVVLLVVFIGWLLVSLVVPAWNRKLDWLAEATPRDLERRVGPFQLWLTVVVTWPITKPLGWLLRWTAFRTQRRALTAFLVSRTIVTGAGCVIEGGRFRLAQKASAVTSECRSSVLPQNRPIFDFGNLMKQLCAPFNFQLRPVLKLFGRRQRLQLGHGDSNRAQVAEWLKVGTTSLLLDLAESGALDDAPRLLDPVAALHAVAEDLDFEEPLPVVGGGTTTALELQRYYLDKARQHLRSSATVSIEARDLVAAWGEVLDALESGNPSALVGRLDWVTKRLLLEEGDDEAVWTTLDLRYHELDEGYFDRLAEALPAPRIVDRADVARAIQHPPHDTPAFARGRLIRERALEVDLPVLVSWDSAVLGGRMRGKVIPFHRPTPG